MERYNTKLSFLSRDHFQKLSRFTLHHVTSSSKKICFATILRNYRSIERCHKTEHFSTNSNTWKYAGFELFQVKVSVDSGGNKMRTTCFFLFFPQAYIHRSFFQLFFFSCPLLKMYRKNINLLIVKLLAFTTLIYFLFTPVFSHYLEKVLLNEIFYEWNELLSQNW